MPFADRTDAGRQLAEALKRHKGKDGVVLGIPRGGVETAYEVARRWNMPLDVVMAKKLPHPHQPELAVGAVSGGHVYLDPRYDLPEDYVDGQITAIRALIGKRDARYHDQVAPQPLMGRTVILVDDGIATGHTMAACIRIIHEQGPKELIVAVPVAPIDTVRRISAIEGVDELVVLRTPTIFTAIGHHYHDFGQVTDQRAIELLERAHRSANAG